MIFGGCSNKMAIPPLLSLFLVLFSVGLPAQVSGASQAAKQSSTGLNAKAPNFVLLNQDGERFDSTMLRGKVVVLNFIFTTCTDVCPLFTANLAEFQRALKNEHSGNVFIVSITTDPEIDSPKVLKAYAQRYQADFQNWAFLTGSESQLKPVWEGFGVRVIKKGRGLVQHTGLTTVIDRQGVRRFNHYGEKWRAADVEKDVLSLLKRKTH